jgi:hypothetical protein
MPHRRQSPKKEMEILRQVTLLEEQGIINVQCSILFSGYLAPKPNDEWRLCVDFRNLNNASGKWYHPMANIKICLIESVIINRNTFVKLITSVQSL